MEKETDDDICLVLICLTLGCGMAMASEFVVNFYRTSQETYDETFDNETEKSAEDSTFTISSDKTVGHLLWSIETEPLFRMGIYDETFDKETEQSADDSPFTIKRYFSDVLRPVGVDYYMLSSSYRLIWRNWSEIKIPVIRIYDETFDKETEQSADDSPFTIKLYFCDFLRPVGVHYIQLPCSRQIRRNWSEIKIPVINQQFLAGTISTTVPNRQDKMLQDAKSPTTTTTVSDKKRVSEDDGHEENFKLNNSNQVTVCGFCVDENEASYICYKCKCHICNACKVVHTKVWILMSHELHKISETTRI